jgi:hypothetical protein
MLRFGDLDHEHGLLVADPAELAHDPLHGARSPG